jgi:hypothetical protein
MGQGAEIGFIKDKEFRSFCNYTPVFFYVCTYLKAAYGHDQVVLVILILKNLFF